VIDATTIGPVGPVVINHAEIRPSNHFEVVGKAWVTHGPVIGRQIRLPGVGI